MVFEKNKIESKFNVSSSHAPLTIACGIVKQNNTGGVSYGDKQTQVNYTEPEKKHGILNCAVLVDGDRFVNYLDQEDHVYALSKTDNAHRMDYYVGACWNYGSDQQLQSQWIEKLNPSAVKIKSPLAVNILTN